METLEILNSETSIQSQKTFLGKVVNYNFMHTGVEGPKVILFTMFDETTSLALVDGQYHPLGDRLQFNGNSYGGNQGELLDHIYDTCQEILLAYTPVLDPVIPE